MNSLILTNQLLIAMPGLADPNFHKTVTYVCAHSDEGAMGIIINRPTNINLSDVLTQMELVPTDPKIGDLPVFQGGPVHRERGFIIYQPLSHWESMIKVSDECGVATSRDILEAICQGNGPQQALVALGYAGWAAGQLEREIAENAWLNGPANQEILFNIAPERRWESAAALIGVDMDRLSPDAGHA
ncbi:MAG: YqgE/AlgH family protein [Gammaproteobacteria bacterium]